MHVRNAVRAVDPPRQSGTAFEVRVTVWTVRRQERLSCAGVFDGLLLLLLRRGGPAPQTRHPFDVSVCAAPVEILAHFTVLDVRLIPSHRGLLRKRSGCAHRRMLSGSMELLT